MSTFKVSKMLEKGIKTAVATGVITGVTAFPAIEADTSDKAILTSIITIASFLVQSFLNWRKHK